MVLTNILHASWLPATDKEFANIGTFVFWAETSQPPYHIDNSKQLERLFVEQLQFKQAAFDQFVLKPITFYATLPSHKNSPISSVEMMQQTGEIFEKNKIEWKKWKLNGLQIESPLPFLKELSFALQQQQNGTVRAGYNLQFWMQYSDQLRYIIKRHLYLPVLKAKHLGKTAAKKTVKQLTFEAGWEPLSEFYEQGIKEYAKAMPLSSRMVHRSKRSSKEIGCYVAEQLLRHFSEQQVDTLVRATKITQKIAKQLDGCWISKALDNIPVTTQQTTEQIADKVPQQFITWKEQIANNEQQVGFTSGLRLQEQDQQWSILFFIESRKDPSLKLTLAEVWDLTESGRKKYSKLLGKQFEKELLITLGQAARIAPLLWQGMENSQPTGLTISLEEAYEFLKNDAEILRSAGFKITVPTWWTAQGRQRTRIRIKAAAGKSSSQNISQDSSGFFNLPSIINYSYELAIGDKTVTKEEWQLLVNTKSPLVQFRGEWLEINSKQMGKTLALMQQSSNSNDSDSDNNLIENNAIEELIKQSAEADADKIEYQFDDVVAKMMEQLQDHQKMEVIEQPEELKGKLRNYQKQGLSWLVYQQAIGFNSILADDMGLGKTIQIIALLLHQHEIVASTTIKPTLLIAPTSVLGNWQKELDKFAPTLSSHIYHGSDREKKPAAFKKLVTSHNLLITSYALARLDNKLFTAISWHRVILDESQNIKNPKSAQTKAIQKLKATHRIAMTGTPIENRLMDLWSVFHFLNPGYLGTAAQFKRSYETPIQRERDLQQSQRLKELVNPFILRRLKTDKNIIDDLPEKIEQKVYCNLTREQASLYQAVVDEVQKQLEEAEGIQRKGLMLATLMKLKQVCNHPAQFLQDGSEFSKERSHKLARVDEMVEEALENGDSILIFSQFTEVGKELEQVLRDTHHCPVYYLHGGTTRKRREQMIETFQDEQSPAGIFILSLKAGGVGITLTRANHVFHFDRWWNPAVENQATDRAFRIGQKKSVFAHKMVTLGTLEERIDVMIEEKQKLAESIVGSDESWLTEMDNAAFTKLIQLNRDTIS